MTTATRIFEIDAFGFSALRRGNSVTFVDMGLMTLGDHLREGFKDAAIYNPYESSIGELYDAFDAAIAEGSDLDANAKDRARVALLHAEDFLTNRPLRVPAPTVEVWENGRIAFEWYVSPDRIVTATIDEVGRLAFAAMVGAERTTGLRVVDGQWPRELIRWIRKVKG